MSSLAVQGHDGRRHRHVLLKVLREVVQRGRGAVRISLRGNSAARPVRNGDCSRWQRLELRSKSIFLAGPCGTAALSFNQGVLEVPVTVIKGRAMRLAQRLSKNAASRKPTLHARTRPNLASKRLRSRLNFLATVLGLGDEIRG